MATNTSVLTPYAGIGLIDLSTTDNSSGSLFASGQAIVTDALITREFNKWKVVSLIIDCTSLSWYKNVLLPLKQNNSPIYFRMGMKSGDSSSVYSPWEQHVIVSTDQDPASSLANTPTKVFVTTADMLFYLNIGDQVTVRKGIISDIVTTIATAKNIPVKTENTFNSQVTLYQSYMTDFMFILKRLLPRAVNQQGFGNYKFFIDGGTLVFSTLDYQASTITSIDFTDALGLVCARDLSFKDRTWEKLAQGSASTSAMIGDPYSSGQVTVYDSNPSTSLSFAGSSTTPTPAQNFTKLMARHVGDNPPAEVAAQAQNVYSSQKTEQFEAHFTVDGNPFLGLASLVSITTSSSYDYSGTYAISRCVHTFKTGVFTSAYTCIRDSSQNPGSSSGPSLTTDTSQNSEPFGGSVSPSSGSSPRIGQTSTLQASSGPYVTKSVQLPG